MARIRTIKPEFFTDAKILSLTPLARLFYVSLWCEADKQGRLKWDPQTLKYRYLPADKAKVDDLAEELMNLTLVRFYEIGGQRYADIPGFLKHQVINNRESESTIPPWSADACMTRESGDTDAACGKEGREGKEGTTPVAPRGAGYAEDFERLWKAYPSRGRAPNPKKTAYAEWMKIIRNGAVPDDLIAAAKFAAPPEKHGTEFVPQMVTWLRQERFNDAPPPVAQVVSIDPERSRWSGRVKGFQQSGFWMTDQWGPKPTEPGCKCPKDIPEWDPGYDLPAPLKRTG